MLYEKINSRRTAVLATGAVAVLAVLSMCLLSISVCSDDSDAAVGSTFTVGDLTYLVTSETGTNNTVSVSKYNAPATSATSVTIPSTADNGGKTYSVTSIGNGAFLDCTALTSVNIGSGVTSIESSAFSSCTALTSVIIGSGVTSIGAYAFNGCIALTSVTIPDKVTSIGEGVFSHCTSLTSFTVDGGNTYYKAVDGVLYSYDGKTLVAYPAGRTNSSYNIPEDVTSIDTGAFYGCTALKSVVIPSGIKSIGESVFYDCTALTSVTIPDSVTSIGIYAFSGCTALTSVTIGSGVTSIGSNAFLGCTALTSVTIPGSVTSIGHSAFFGCTHLTSVAIPDSVTTIGGSAFSGCTALTSFTVGIVNTYYKAVDGVLYSIGGETLVAYPAGRTNSSYNIPEDVTSICEGAFSGCTALKSVVIPSGIKSIGAYAFYGCASLTSVAIPDSVKSIGDGAFYGCTALKSVVIPSGIKSIGAYAFYGCASLTSVAIPDSVTSIGAYAFYGCTSVETIRLLGSVNTIGNDAFALGTSDKTATATVYCPTDYTIPAIGINSYTTLDPEKKTMYASWFVVDGMIVSTGLTENGLSISAPTDPVRAGYTFLGWYSDGSTTAATFPMAMTADALLYAQWKASSGGSDNTMLYVGIGAAVVIVMAVEAFFLMKKGKL